MPNKGSKSTDDHMILVNCGRCYPCLSNKRNGWTFRMIQETEKSDSSLFITLTYDENNIKYAWNKPKGPNLKYTLQELYDLYSYNATIHYSTPTIDKKDLQLFNKRLRARIMEEKGLSNDWFKINEESGEISPKYRFLGVGEYGEESNRPHFHIIAWNIPDTWFEWNDVNKEYYSDKLESLWDKGYIKIGTVTQQSIHYCAKYTLKDIFKSPDENSMAEKPFATMSRNPGIGQCYVTDDIKNYYSKSLNPYATIQDKRSQFNRHLAIGMEPRGCARSGRTSPCRRRNRRLGPLELPPERCVVSEWVSFPRS